jgi:hypothetical protein
MANIGRNEIIADNSDADTRNGQNATDEAKELRNWRKKSNSC